VQRQVNSYYFGMSLCRKHVHYRHSSCLQNVAQAQKCTILGLTLIRILNLKTLAVYLGHSCRQKIGVTFTDIK